MTRLARQWSCGEIIFSLVSGGDSVHRGASPCDHYHWWTLLSPVYGTSSYRDPPWPWTWPHWTWDLTVQILKSSGQDWRPFQTCSLKDTPNCYWHLVATEVHMVSKQAVCILLECFLVTYNIRFGSCCLWSTALMIPGILFGFWFQD